MLLSSQGAHRPDSGPVARLGELEERLKTINGLNIMALRAGYFFQNLFASIPMIKGMQAYGSSLKPDVKVSMVHTADIAQKALKHLLALNFKGYNLEYVPGAADYDMTEVSAILGKAVRGEAFPYIQFAPEQELQGMLQAGLPETIAKGYSELYACINQGDYFSDFTRTPENSTPSRLEDFAEREFKPAFLNA